MDIAQNQRMQGTEIKHPFNNDGSTMRISKFDILVFDKYLYQ